MTEFARESVLAVRLAIEFALRDPDAARALLGEARAAIREARAVAEFRADDMGYNPYRNKGKFAPGPHKKPDHVARAQGHVATAAARLAVAGHRVVKAHAAKAKAVATAKSAIGSAKAKAAASRRDPTEANIAAAKKAVTAAMKARATVSTRDQQIAQHTAAHAAATTKHALATATLAEAQRRSSTPNTPLPKPVEVSPHGIGFERVHGEHDTGAQELSASPDFHLGATMGRIHGEGEHAVVEHAPEPVRDPGPGQAPKAAAQAASPQGGGANRPRQVVFHAEKKFTDAERYANEVRKTQERKEHDRRLAERDTARRLANQPTPAGYHAVEEFPGIRTYVSERTGQRYTAYDALRGTLDRPGVQAPLPRAAVEQRAGLLARIGAKIRGALRSDGPGYNPYRNHGKFAPGPHKERPHGERRQAGAAATHEGAHPRAALAKARAAAKLARSHPTEANVAAARAAVGAAAKAAGQAKAARIASAAAAVDRHGARMVALEKAAATRSAAHADATAAAKHATESARAKAQIARDKPTLRNTRAAAAANNKARRAVAKISQHDMAVMKSAGAHQAAVERYVAATQKHAALVAKAEGKGAPAGRGKAAAKAETAKSPSEQLAAAERSAPRGDGSLVEAIGNGAIRDRHGELTGLTPAAQAAIRQHFNNAIAAQGISSHNLRAESGTLHSKSEPEMGGADAWYSPSTGNITVSGQSLADLGYHAQQHTLDSKGMMESFRRSGHEDAGMLAYNVMAHESIHGHGPIIPQEAGAMHKYQFAEEMATEMSARQVTARAHGFDASKMRGGGYDDIMQAAVGHVAAVAGVPHEVAFAAVGRSAVAFKSLTGSVTADQALDHMAHNTMHILGKTQTHLDDLKARWRGLSEEMARLYPWP